MGERSLTYPLSQEVPKRQYNVQFDCIIRCIAGELSRGQVVRETSSLVITEINSD